MWQRVRLTARSGGRSGPRQPLRLQIDSLFRHALAFVHVESVNVNRIFVGRGAGILHYQNIAARLSFELTFEVRIG